jgi:hypothetical protein
MTGSAAAVFAPDSGYLDGPILSSLWTGKPDAYSWYKAASSSISFSRRW